jgi:MFS family permease
MSSTPAARAPADALRWLPSPTVIFAITLGVILLSITLARGTQDPDYFWHLTAGRLIATTGSVPSTDPFSFTWAGQPWTPHEWLSELLIYRIVAAVGTGGALALFGVLGPLTFAVLAIVLRRHGVGTLPIVAASALGALVLVPFVTVRPQAISWLLMAVLLATLWELRPEQRWWAMALVPLFVLWANLHGLWVLGLGMVAVYTLFTLAGRTAMAPAWRWMLAVAVGCVLASMLTPAGPIGILYPLRYIQPGNWGLANIQEWQSPSFHDPANWGLLALIVAFALNGTRGAPGWLAALGYLGLVGALLAARNEPIFAVWATPVLALGLNDRLSARAQSRPARVHSTRHARGRRILELGLGAIVALSAALIILPASPFAVAKGDQATYPDRAVSVLLRLKPDARVLAEYGWGGYVISRVYDAGGRVFVDGRNEMYSEQILNDYSRIRAADAGWSELATRYGVEAMLFPPEVPITKGPAQSTGWCEAYRDAQSVLLVDDCTLLGQR